ncbi:MAG: GAF domain-containing protein, partial [Myxococcales bacterium]|nr:GAF domain-containing protein [Myxococcales bacterium]
ELARVRLALAHRSPEQLLAQPSLVEPAALLIARLFYKASGAAFIVDPQMSAICALRLIRRDGGLTVYSAAAFATYSLLLGQVLSDLRGMERYGQLALALLERRPDAGVSILVHFLYGGMIGFWSRPLRECAEHLRIACARGEELGDLTLTIAARGLLVFNLLSSGAPLGEVARAAEEARRVAHRARHGATVANMTLILRVVHALQVPASGELSLSGDGLDEDAMTVEYKGLRAKLPRISVTHLRAFALMTLGRAREALPLIEAIHAKGRRRLINSYWVVEHAFLRALALVDAADRAAPIPRARLLWQIERERRRLRRWAQSCPANVTAKLALVEAELARLRGDHVASPRRYEASIRAAIDHDLGHDEALARERAAGYYLERGFDEIGALHLRSARLAHDRWGAAAKVELLERHHAGILRARDDTPGSERASRTGTRTRGATHVSGSEIDLDSVLEAAEFFARSDELDRILQGAIEALVACASASRGGLILADVGHLKLRALLDPDLGASAQALDQRLEEADAVPRSLIHLSYRTSEVVVVGDVGDSPLAARDPYFTRQRVRAAACFPLALAREGAALGVIYLENTLTPRAFTAARVRVISALASQLAIAVERVRLLRALREATQVAEEASAAKSSFLLRLSHELRTPLNVIIGYGDYLRELREDDEELVEITSAIQSSGRRLLESVSRVLDLTGAAAGDSRLAAAPVVVAALLAEARASIEPLLVDSRVTARVRCEPPDLVILADRYRLERIVAILAQNAAKFTREGAVALEARLSPDPDAATHVELTIIDTGIGISSEHHGQIFEAFTQVDGAVTREHEGLGLGLSVCRHFAAELGAQLEVESAPGQGSRFTVRLPYVPATR